MTQGRTRQKLGHTPLPSLGMSEPWKVLGLDIRGNILTLSRLDLRSIVIPVAQGPGKVAPITAPMEGAGSIRKHSHQRFDFTRVPN